MALAGEIRDSNLLRIVDRIRRLIGFFDTGQLDGVDVIKAKLREVIITPDYERNPILLGWNVAVAELEGIIRTSRTDEPRARRLVNAVRRVHVAMDSGDQGSLKYSSDELLPVAPTPAWIDDKLYRLFMACRQELHMGVTLALNNQTFEEWCQLQIRIREEHARELLAQKLAES